MAIVVLLLVGFVGGYFYRRQRTNRVKYAKFLYGGDGDGEVEMELR